jgi:2-dehydro-3-deoxygalactonokinase
MHDIAMIAVDWGTSNFRAYLLGPNGEVTDTRQADSGIMKVADGAFAPEFERLIGDWLKAHPKAPVLMAGMIGCEQGWSLATHVKLPTSLDALSRAMHPVEVGPGRTGYIVPGLTTLDLGGVPDIIRGEETQVAGIMDELPGGSGLLCLPGTHSKWLSIEDGVITRFYTNMSGELLEAMSLHSILGRLMEPNPAGDPQAFRQGLERSREPGGLLHHLFGVRTQGYYQNIAGSGLHSYLAGILLGHELQGMLEFFPPPQKALIVGGQRIGDNYAAAMDFFGLDYELKDGGLAFVRGLWNLARAAGLA